MSLLCPQEKTLYPDAQAYAEACRLFPGGVQSPVRSFKAVQGQPLFIQKGSGAYLFDRTGRSYIDYMGAWGAALLGHAHPRVLSELEQTMRKGLCFGACTELEYALGHKIQQHMPHLEQLRFCNSGTEATMTALRLARGYTRRESILLFEGGYHGHHDYSLERAGAASGIPAEIAELVYRIPYNDIPALQAFFAQRGESLAAVLIEPILCNMGCVLPNPLFLQTVREQCSAYGVVLIFDEVVTGFRIALGGAREYCGVVADLTTLGKIIGGGLPIGVLGGRAEIMSHLAPCGAVYHAGTFAGNPASMQAGLSTLSLLEEEGTYARLESMTRALMEGIQALSQRFGIPLQTPWAPGCFSLFLSPTPIQRYSDSVSINKPLFERLFHGLLSKGIYWTPSPMEAAFVSLAHTQAHIEETLLAMEDIFPQLLT